jgi:hypothetical protein
VGVGMAVGVGVAVVGWDGMRLDVDLADERRMRQWQ